MTTPEPTITVPDIYRLKCKAKTANLDVQRFTMKNGRPATRARCTVCGSGKYLIGGV